ERLAEAGIAVSAFVDPEPRQLDALAAIGEDVVSGFEINTDAYTRARGESEARMLVERMAEVARHGHGLGFRVYAGHGLTAANVHAIATLPHMEELNIGHWLISRAVIVGLREAVREMLAAMG